MDDQKPHSSRTEETARKFPSDNKPIGMKGKSRHIEVTPEERHRLIAQRAYYLAEERGFSPGSELDDWFKAEAEVETLLRRGSERQLIV